MGWGRLCILRGWGCIGSKMKVCSKEEMGEGVGGGLMMDRRDFGRMWMLMGLKGLGCVMF